MARLRVAGISQEGAPPYHPRVHVHQDNRRGPPYIKEINFSGGQTVQKRQEEIRRDLWVSIERKVDTATVLIRFHHSKVIEVWLNAVIGKRANDLKGTEEG